MKIDILKGRLGHHRFHMMLVHFPSALYPFSLCMDLLSTTTGKSEFSAASLYALTGAIGMSIFAVIYGAIDFVQIDTRSSAWKTAGIHALLNTSWFLVFATLLFFRMKHPDISIGWIYLTVMSFATAGLFFSNYLGGELVIKHKIGIRPHGDEAPREK